MSDDESRVPLSEGEREAVWDVVRTQRHPSHRSVMDATLDAVERIKADAVLAERARWVERVEALATGARVALTGSPNCCVNNQQTGTCGHGVRGRLLAWTLDPDDLRALVADLDGGAS